MRLEKKYNGNIVFWRKRIIFDDGKVIKYTYKGVEIVISFQDKMRFESKYWFLQKSSTKGDDKYYLSTKAVFGVWFHRLIMRAKHGEFVDHINRNPCDCRRENLRITTIYGNNLNTSIRHNKIKNTPIGVSARIRGNNTYYVSSITIMGKQTYIGFFKTPEEAHNAFLAKAKEREELYRKNNLIK